MKGFHKYSLNLANVDFSNIRQVFDYNMIHKFAAVTVSQKHKA